VGRRRGVGRPGTAGKVGGQWRKKKGGRRPEEEEALDRWVPHVGERER
jgi:hypothetical protein